AVTPVSVLTTPRVRKPLLITKPPSVTSTTATPVVPAPISADDIGDVPPPPTSPEGVGEVEDRVPAGAVGSTVDPSVAASTKAAVNISSRRASTAPAIVSEGARTEQGPNGGAVSPGDAIRRFFHGSLPWKVYGQPPTRKLHLKFQWSPEGKPDMAAILLARGAQIH
ncbi:hypothetical protein THAOC_34116, partial [Thalassiosira oceanica]